MEKQKTSSKRKAAIKVIVAVLLIAIMTGISFAVANFVHNRKSVQASSVKNGRIRACGAAGICGKP